MRCILTIIMLVMLTSCVYQEVNYYDMQRAVTFCGDSANVAHVTATFTGNESVRCFDGTYAKLYTVGK